MKRVVLAIVFLGCGAAPPVVEDTEALVSELPSDAPLTGTVRPAGLVAALEAVAGRSKAVRERIERRGLPKALDTELLAGLGVDPDRVLAFAVRVGPRLALLRTADDLERLLATNAEAFDAWIDKHPPPPAWLHVRVAGHEVGGDPEEALQSRFGALQVVRPGEPLAGVLEADPGRPLPEGATLYRLLALEAPTVVMVQRRGDRTLVDLIIDEGLGPGALAAGFAAIEVADDPVPVAHRPIEPLPPDALARFHLSHERWGVTIRALGEVVALRAALDGPPGPHRGRLYAVARAAARRPALLMDPGAPAFDNSVVNLRQRGAHLVLRVRAGYTPVGRALSALSGGRSPVGHLAARRFGGAVVTVSGAKGWKAVLDGVVDPPRVDAGRFLAAAIQCGPVCYPALWTAFPSLALVAEQAGAAIFPTLAQLKAALPVSTGLDLVRTPKGAAAAVRFARPATEARSAWNTLGGGGITKRWVDRTDGITVVLGDDPLTVESLARGDATQSDALLQVTADLAPEESTTFDRVEAIFSFRPEALEIDADLRLRPVAE